MGSHDEVKLKFNDDRKIWIKNLLKFEGVVKYDKSN